MALPLNKKYAKVVYQTKDLYTARHVVFERASWKKIMKAAINVRVPL